MEQVATITEQVVLANTVSIEGLVVDNTNTIVDNTTELNSILSNQGSSDTILVDNTNTIVAESSDSITIVTGLIGPKGSDGIDRLNLLNDVDISNLQNGSLLIYSNTQNKWFAGNELNNQTLEAGQY